MHLVYSENLLKGCKKEIDREKKKIDKQEKIIRATEGKSEEEKARIIADTLRADDSD